ncbi:MAG: carbohydrate ABC transporter permease [Chloroflexi bacterium]|nr:carbohydrate ABC transporter permease [Chloroflexota bacterium]
MASRVSMAPLWLVGLLWCLPLLWSMGTSLRSPREPVGTGWLWLPGTPTLENFGEAWNAAPFVTYYINTVIICAGILAVQLVTVTLAGYAFARLRFPGREFLFGLFIFQLLLPLAVLAVPNFLTMRDLHLINNKLAIMLPYMASGFGVFLMRQAFRNVPVELDEASRIDGCRWWQVIWHVYLPMTRPSLVAFGIVSVTFHWNDFLWPLLVTNTPNARPLTVGLASFATAGENGAQYPLIMAGTLMVMAPILIGFLLFQRQFVSSFAHTGIR